MAEKQSAQFARQEIGVSDVVHARADGIFSPRSASYQMMLKTSVWHKQGEGIATLPRQSLSAT